MSAAPGGRESLLVLVGITATANSRKSVSQYFVEHSPYDVFVPRLPFRAGVRDAALWVKRYLEKTVRVHERGAFNVLAYIGGGAVLRCLASTSPLTELARVLYIRGPIQELVPKAVVGRYGRLLARLLAGQTMIDLADGWPAALPFPASSKEQGLIVEHGVSAWACSLGLSSESVPPSAWNPARLLPAASDVLPRPESHDEVYTSPGLLSSALIFFRHGRFRAPSPAATLA